MQAKVKVFQGLFRDRLPGAIHYVVVVTGHLVAGSE